MTEKQTNTFVVLSHNGDMHSLTMAREEGELAKIAISGDIKMLEGRWEIIKSHIDRYFEEMDDEAIRNFE